MPTEPKSFEEAISAKEFSSDDYCGTSYAARMLGLSVATVQSLVEKGEIEAWKTLGGHRRISLAALHTYRLKHSPQLARPDADPKLRLRVLLVEDDENTRELYKCQFDDWNLPVDCTSMPSALEALMDIASMRPDVLITDLSMPGVDGIEMLKALKRNQQLADMHIVVISGLAPEAIEARGGLPQHAQWIQKPVNFDWLQGYLTALVSVNVKARAASAAAPRKVSSAHAADPFVKPVSGEAGVQNAMA